MTATLTCANCGGGLDPADRFCGHCGAESPSGVLSFPFSDDQSDWDDLVDRLRRATLGEYEIAHELGRGGMAAVFLAHEIQLSRKVAIKVMAPGLLLGDGMVERFRHEAITIARLQHPHIVSIYSVRRAEGLYFFVMQYIPGRSLDQVLARSGRLPVPMVRSVLHQVGSALTYAHRSGVVHRDIKPGNILIDRDGSAVVTDFGIAKAAASPTKTITGALVGTPAYMSPEQCRGEEVSGASDQYALGAVAYEMLAGVPPFGGSTLTVMQAHVERDPAPIRERWPDCPPELEAAVLRMLAKAPTERWPRIADAMAALGAEPLAEDDALRHELIQLAAAEGPFVGGTPTPTSPVPRTHASPGRSGALGRAVGGIAILPPPAGLEVGDSFVLVAMVRGQRGTRLPPSAVQWSSSPPGILRFDSGGGVAVAIAEGTTVLTASCNGVRTDLRIEVASARADEIAISPLDRPVGVGDEIRLEAVARDKRGDPVSRRVAWRSTDSGIATVTAEGALMARSPGFTRVTAVLDDVEASLVIPVLPARVAAVRVEARSGAVEEGASFTVPATPVDRWGTPLAERPVLWSSSDVRVAVVAAGGIVHALRAGSAVLTASCEGMSESIRLDVRAVPAPAPLEEPQPRRRRVRRRRQGRTWLALAAAGLVAATLWSARRPALVETGAAPAALVEAPPAQAADSEPATPVVITPRPGRAPRRAAPEARASSISIAPPAALQVGDSADLEATVLDRRGSALADADIAWQSSNPSVVQVEPRSGRVRAQAPGTALVFARSGDQSAIAELTVFAPPVAAIEVRGVEPLVVGQAIPLWAVTKNAGGAVHTANRVVWRTSDASVATVDPATGVLAARAPGSAEITALSEGRTGTAVVTVAARSETVEAGLPVAERERIGAWLRDGAEKCYAALLAKDVVRLAALYRPASREDEDNLRKLGHLLRTGERFADVGDRVDRARRIGREAASIDFSVQLTWTEPSGGRLSSQPVFRARVVKAGAGWETASCRLVGSPGF